MLLPYQKQPPNEPNSKEVPTGTILMVHSQNGNVIQMLLFQSILSHPRTQGKGAGYIFINILDPDYVFTPPETPAKCPQLVLESPVRSGYLPPSASNRDRDRLALLRKLIKTGPDRY